MSLRVVPLTLAQANDAVERLHRHHKKAQGHRFSIGVLRDETLVGAAIVGRPVARGCDPYAVAEVHATGHRWHEERLLDAVRRCRSCRRGDGLRAHPDVHPADRARHVAPGRWVDAEV